MQTFKFSHMTAIYDGGKYTLTADKGYTLRHRTTGTTAPEAVTRDYTRYECIPSADAKPSAKANKKSAKANLKTAKAEK